MLICGAEKINMKNWIQNTTYENYNSKEKVIIWFWDIVKSFTDEEKILLVHFVTGSNKVPAGFFEDLTGIREENKKFTVTKIACDHDKILPFARTCTNTLLLPEYSSKKKLKEKLLFANNGCREGFEIF
ncbi:NEDD4-like E3 ubiquitin-protein ligase (WWP2) [Vairimorpha necatrix]|uniref:HECT-type E3 ubiquitin transferase n=1 Tax=Vairimorpha necatrix TaxID=6039 RepID=A0AAX4JCH5_9MICR